MGNYSKQNIIKLKLIPSKEAFYINNISLYLGSYYIKHEKKCSKNRKFYSFFPFSIFRYPLLAMLYSHDDKF